MGPNIYNDFQPNALKYKHPDVIISMMFIRFKHQELQNALLRSPDVVLLGPRQVGKTTLALDVAQPDGGYLDLESPEDSSKLSNAGAEIDLLLTWPNGEHWAIEIKRSTTPKVERGFYSACEDIQPSRRWMIYPGSQCYPLGDGIEVMSLHSVMQALV